MRNAVDEALEAVGHIRHVLADSDPGIDNRKARSEIRAQLRYIGGRLSCGKEQLRSIAGWTTILYSRHKWKYWGAGAVAGFIEAECAGLETMMETFRDPLVEELKEIGVRS